MSHSVGAVRFKNGDVKYFEYNESVDVCIPKLFNTFEEFISSNWKWINTQSNCEHNIEDVDIYTTYGGGFYWKGTACKKCMMIIGGINPYNLRDRDGKELFIEDVIVDGIPKWAMEVPELR